MARLVEVVAHRGASAYAPEHTFEAYDLALDMGADALELDLRATADGELVVLHDPTFERTAGDPRAVADLPLAEVPEQTLRLHDVIERYRGRTSWLLELKDPEPPAVVGLVRALRAHALGPRELVQAFHHRALAQPVHQGDVKTFRHGALVQSFHHRALRWVRHLAPEVVVAPLFEGQRPAAIARRAPRAARYARAIGVEHTVVNEAVVSSAHDRGLELRAYTVNERDEMDRLVALGVDGLITDAPDIARRALRERRTAPV
jgi:glycerophosphoryl diester phosphodiesterase